MPAPEWERLGDYVIARRLALGYPTRAKFAKAVDGVSPRTLASVELGQPVTTNTLGVVEAALRWQPGSARAILAGGHPSPVEDGGPVPEPDPRISVKGLSAEEIEAIENMKRLLLASRDKSA